MKEPVIYVTYASEGRVICGVQKACARWDSVCGVPACPLMQEGKATGKSVEKVVSEESEAMEMPSVSCPSWVMAVVVR